MIHWHLRHIIAGRSKVQGFFDFRTAHAPRNQYHGEPVDEILAGSARSLQPSNSSALTSKGMEKCPALFMGGLQAAKPVGLVSLVVEIGYVVSIRVNGDSTT